MGSKVVAKRYCAQVVLDLLSRSWTVDILLVLATDGPTRFGALQRRIEGISSRVLTERLRLLEDQKLVFRHYEPTIPPAVTYGLTQRTEDLQKCLEAFEQFSRKWQEEDVLV